LVGRVGGEGGEGKSSGKILRLKGGEEKGGRGKYPPNSEIVGSWMGFSGFMK